MGTRLTLDLDQATCADLWMFADALRAWGTPPDRRVERADAPAPGRLEVQLSDDRYTSNVPPKAWHGPFYPGPLHGPHGVSVGAVPGAPGMFPPGMVPPGMVPPGVSGWTPGVPVRHGGPRRGGVLISGTSANGEWRLDVPAETVQRWQAALREVLDRPDVSEETRAALTNLLDSLNPPNPRDPAA